MHDNITGAKTFEIISEDRRMKYSTLITIKPLVVNEFTSTLKIIYYFVLEP